MRKFTKARPSAQVSGWLILTYCTKNLTIIGLIGAISDGVAYVLGAKLFILTQQLIFFLLIVT